MGRLASGNVPYMTDINITPMAPHEYGVQLVEGGLYTGHRVRVPEEFLDEWFPSGVDEKQLVRASFEFLLEREPATSILTDFGLDRIGDFFPEYLDELRTRLAG
jgi:hypothetical protein